MPSTDYRPTVAQVGAILRARTVAGMSGEQGTFTADTRPTADQVETLIDLALADVSIRVGADVPDETWGSLASVVALRAAMRVELSYFPEQIGTNRPSPYVALADVYERELAAAVEGVRQAGSGDDSGSVDDAKLPRYASEPDLYSGDADYVTIWVEGEPYVRRFLP